jgi:hypothetical protein
MASRRPNRRLEQSDEENQRIIARILQLRQTGMSYTDIAKTVGFSRSFVTNAIAQRRWPTDYRGAKKNRRVVSTDPLDKFDPTGWSGNQPIGRLEKECEAYRNMSCDPRWVQLAPRHFMLKKHVDKYGIKPIMPKISVRA